MGIGEVRVNPGNADKPLSQGAKAASPAPHRRKLQNPRLHDKNPTMAGKNAGGRFKGKKRWERKAKPGGGPRRPEVRRERRHGDRALLFGWHSVKAALENPARRIHRLLVTENGARRLEEAGLTARISPEIVRPEAIDALLSPDSVHQGLYAETDPLPAPALDEIPPGIVLVLDQVTDPHNFGAIVRSAAAFDVKAIVTTARHSPEATGVLAKSASGGLEHVPIVLVQNLARTMTELKSTGFLLVGLAEEGGVDLADAPLTTPLALVIGAEGKGLRQLTRETCDLLARLDLPGAIKSLNVSNATALALQLATMKLAGRV
jgi:23S rRNA (guanosine2251-2'-O)-methyltransferase